MNALFKIVKLLAILFLDIDVESDFDTDVDLYDTNGNVEM